MKELKAFRDMIDRLSMEPSSIGKENILFEYRENLPILSLVYDKRINFYVSRETLERYCSEDHLPYFNIKEDTSIITILRYLSDRKVTGNDSMNLCYSFIKRNIEYSDVIIRIIDKDLRCGISSTTINKVFPGSIKEFSVPLAKKYVDGICDFRKDSWFLSRKLDGVRCLAFIEKDGVTLFSRNGIEFKTLDTLKSELSLFPESFEGQVLDGEVCMLDEGGKENFYSIIKEINRKDHTILRPKFYVFDIYPIEEFISKEKTSEEYSKRISTFGKLFPISKFIEVLSFVGVHSLDHLNNCMETVPKDWEGLMLRKNDCTEFKRTNNLLKIKKFNDKEFTVIDMNIGNKVIDGVERKVVSSIVASNNGLRIEVGSGLSDKQRLEWYRDSSKIVGKEVTVSYFEESVNQKGETSLRFPTLKHVWEEEKI